MAKLSGRFVLVMAVVLGLGALAFSACGGDDDNNDNGGGSTPQTTRATGSPTRAAASPTAASGTTPVAETPVSAGGGATSVTITAKDFSFDPDEAEVNAGEAVTFTLKNEGSAPHTLTFYSDEDFTQAIDGATTERVSAGSSDEFTTTFATAGEVYFRCEVHPTQMKGEVKVQ